MRQKLARWIRHIPVFVKGLLAGIGVISRTDMDKSQEAYYSQFIKPGDLCFDVGANLGNRTDIFLALGATVVCVEPQPHCVRALRTKYRWNRRVQIVEEGLASEPGSMTLLICSTAPSISTFNQKWTSGRFRDYTWDKKIEVPVSTLDALIGRYGKPAFCKIDVEGFEYQVLQGLSSPIRAVTFEFTREFMDDALMCMEKLSTLGRVEFSFTLSENLIETQSAWMDKEAIAKELANIDNSGLWGDICARFQMDS